MTTAPTPSIGARMRAPVLVSTIAVLWSAGWVAAIFLLTPADASTHAMGTNLPAMVARAFGMRTLPTTLLAPWFAEIALIVAFVTFAVFALGALVDRAGHSTRALCWSLRTLPCLAAWTCILTACAWLTTLTPLHDYAWCFAYIAVLMAPLLFLRADIVARDRPPLFWMPAWPGLPAIVATLLALVLLFGGGNMVLAPIQNAHPEWFASWWIAVPLDLAMWALELALSVYVLSAWQHRWNWSQAGQGLPGRSVAAGMRVLVAFDLQFLWLSVLLFLPMWWGLPVFLDAIAKHLMTHTLGGTARFDTWFLRASEFLVQYWWFGLLAAWGALQYWVQFTARARSLRQAGQEYDLVRA